MTTTLDKPIDIYEAWILEVNPEYRPGRARYYKQGHHGYTDNIYEAHRFSEAEAQPHAASSGGKYLVVRLFSRLCNSRTIDEYIADLLRTVKREKARGDEAWENNGIIERARQNEMKLRDEAQGQAARLADLNRTLESDCEDGTCRACVKCHDALERALELQHTALGELLQAITALPLTIHRPDFDAALARATKAYNAEP